MVRAAEMIHNRHLNLHEDADPDALRAALLAVKGIGPWTADYTVMRVSKSRDIFLQGDVAVQKGARNLGLDLTPKELGEWAKEFAPGRSYLCAHLWRAA